ncbi:copper transport protein ATOX1 [Harmonia axyridis]|uniref:copper transport protein ATOX1 n=1 Tax=Harmonia axyridis TaxID=115357 RepID=UPI001E278398|nr:copper transport protein ATOX1 [Harmonia axyridis]
MPAYEMAAVQVHEYNVKMTCEGCSGAVERVLGKLRDKGVQDFTISLPDQKVEVKTSLSSEEILETIKKTGKEVKYLSSHI